MFKLLSFFFGRHPNAMKRPGAWKEMFKQRLLPLPTEKWRESIIMKNAFILSCHVCPLPKKKKKKCCCKKLQRASGARPMRMCVPRNIYFFSKKSTSDSKILLRAGLELIPNPLRKSGAWWWLTRIGWISRPRVITASSSLLQKLSHLQLRSV